MHVITVRNVAAALPAGLSYLLSNGEREKSRAGPVLVAPEPVTTVYARPTERVLHSAVRDANPFFHLAEACWMLAGRDDAEFLNRFVRDFGDRFAEPDGRIHGAYGHRWRLVFGFDQLEHVISVLRKDPTSRQCVLQMWDADAGGNKDLTGEWRDRPCNTHAYLRIRHELVTIDTSAIHGLSGVHQELRRYLDLTVCCRSNDAIWGAYGANAVHFSVLQEYLAARVGVRVGTYYQISNNYHVYLSEVGRLCRRAFGTDDPSLYHDLWKVLDDQRYSALVSGGSGNYATVPVVRDPLAFDGELLDMLRWYECEDVLRGDTRSNEIRNPFLWRTVWPALMAHRARGQKRRSDAEEWLSKIEAEDWRAACAEWCMRRNW